LQSSAEDFLSFFFVSGIVSDIAMWFSNYGNFGNYVILAI